MSHTVDKTGRGAGGPGAPRPPAQAPPPFGVLDEMSLCHSSAHRAERYAEMVLCDTPDSARPESEPGRYQCDRFM